MKRLLIGLLFVGTYLIIGNGDAFCLEDIAWERISQEMTGANTVWVDIRNPRLILAGTDRGVYSTEDGGVSWRPILHGANKKVNFIYVDAANINLMYVCCDSGLFFSRNQGKHWRRIYGWSSNEESGCSALIKLGKKKFYLGTKEGLFTSKDNGVTWQRYSGRLGSMAVEAMSADEGNQIIYLVAVDGVYKIEPGETARRIFVLHPETYLEDKEEDEEVEYKINHICLDSNNPRVIYLATVSGIFKSEDKGESWVAFPDIGLLSKGAQLIMLTSKSNLLAATKSSIFTYNKNRWQELSLGLSMQDIRSLAVDYSGNIYAAGDKGIFRSKKQEGSAYLEVFNKEEPTVQQVQQMAIKYAQVVDPAQIDAHRSLARIKAVLPELSLDYDKTISTYNSSSVSRFAIGPRDWGISLKWDLGDLIWSEQQRLIDSQVRLMVKLRQDIIDEVTRLYFERCRLQLELSSLANQDLSEKQKKRLRIEELTALIDGLTGGCFSKFTLTE